jgi:protein-S-isoprenylcysteine O-methyltransferase Ste14
MAFEPFSRRQLAAKAAIRLVAGFVVLTAMLVVPAGTLDYWQAWVYLCVLFVPVTLVLLYLLVHDPELLERRMRMKEPRAEQAIIVKMGSVCYVLAFLVPGLDRRFGLSQVPVAAIVTADVLVLLGYGLFVLVLRENSYASRVVEVEQGQRVITTGPYAVVRHPMYVAALVTFSSTPVALGSWWALGLVVPLVAVLVARIRHEERLLRKDLEGYQEYAETTRYRLIPGVW